MSRVEVRDFGEPEAVVNHPLGVTYQVRVAQTVISRFTVLQPGWSWEELARPRSEPHHASSTTEPVRSSCRVSLATLLRAPRD
jgi:hypothetical protein